MTARRGVRGALVDSSEDARAFLQRRVRLYVAVIAVFFGLMTIAGMVKILFVPLAMFGDADLLRLQAWQSQWLIGGLFAVVTMGYFALRRPRSGRVLSAIESVGTVAACLAMTQAVWFLPHGAPLMIVAMPVTLVLVLRAALVPSSVRVTLGVGLVVTAAMTALVAARIPPGASPMDRFAWAFPLVWGLAFSAATAIVCRVIYGLEQRVRAAQRLGNYTLADKLGEGGMGEVYLAHHALLKRPTAIKLLPPERVGARAIARFEREVRELSRLSHPNTVAIYDFGRTPEGIFYYAMEYLEGLDLAQLVELEGPQPPGRVIHVLAQVAHALAEAHDEGLIHRDIKPANIILCERGGVSDLAKVVDFGLVKDIRAPSAAASTSDVLTGTPLFMAPESITRPDRVDGRTDLYALGAVGYFLLTGEYVFDGPTLVEVCSHHLHSEPVPPSRYRDVPRDLEAVILRCLAKAPGDRYPSARALRGALLACGAAGSWDEEAAEAWWRDNGAAIADLRARERGPSASPTELAIELARRAPSPLPA